MWLVLRNKKSVNTVLRKFEVKDVSHKMTVNDVVKFGRVNFKISAIKSNKVAKNVQGGYHLLEEKNKEIADELEKLYAEAQNLKTLHRSSILKNDLKVKSQFGQKILS